MSMASSVALASDDDSALSAVGSVRLVGQTAAVPLAQLFQRLAPRRGDLIGRFATALVVEEGRRAGDPETRIAFDHLLPPPGDDEQSRARWRLATSAARLYPPPMAREPLSAWHGADGAKGRRLLAGDLANDNRVAALLAWHFEPDTSGRPHLVTAGAVRHGIDRTLEAEYLVALWLLVCVAAAIDRRTIRRGRVGLVRDRAIDLGPAQLELMGFRRGRRADGYEGGFYVFDS